MIMATSTSFATISSTFQSYLPLTTTFTPPVSCFSIQTEKGLVLQTKDPDYPFYHLPDRISSECLPSGWKPFSFFSPGLCPSHYYVAGDRAFLVPGESTEHWGVCCPTGYDVIIAIISETSDEVELCSSQFHSSTSDKNLQLTSEPAKPTPIYVEPVLIKWRAEDFAPATSAPNTKNSLSTNAQAGIAVGVTAGASLIVIICFGLFCLRRSCSNKLHRDLLKYRKVPDGDVEGDLDRKPVYRSDSAWLSWNAATLDTWFYEIIAIFFSIICFVSIFAILQVYNRKIKPKIALGLTLNAIISIIGTAAKSSLLFVVSECISQLRWISFRSASQPLFSAQAYDSASRGPWGSLQIMIRDKFRSFVTLGASIIVLALAFDPFVQQIVTYEIRNTKEISNLTNFPHSLYIISDPEDMTLLMAVKSAIWKKVEDLEPPCPFGNCKWPSFQSVEVCNVCEDFTAQAKLQGCTTRALISLEETTAAWKISCNISLPSGASWTHQVKFSRAVSKGHDEIRTLVPNHIVWLIDSLNNSEHNGYLYSDLPNETHVGVENPLAVFGHAVLALQHDENTQKPTIKHPVVSIRLVNMTKCALSFCLNTYNMSVENGTRSIKQLKPDFGNFYKAPPMDDRVYQREFGASGRVVRDKICWKPKSQPYVDWGKNSYARAPVQNPENTLTDTKHFQFCGFESHEFVNSMAILGSKMIPYMLNDTQDEWFEDFTSVSPDQMGGPEFQMVTILGLQKIMDNVALSVSRWARSISNATITGSSGTPESYIIVNWPWLALPAALIILGVILLVSTVLSSIRRKTSLWKSSILPFLYHGLEENLVKRDNIELISEMNQATEKVVVRLDLLDTDNRTILRGISKDSHSAEQRRERRHSL